MSISLYILVYLCSLSLLDIFPEMRLLGKKDTHVSVFGNILLQYRVMIIRVMQMMQAGWVPENPEWVLQDQPT